jgi:hypothetical protein
MCTLDGPSVLIAGGLVLGASRPCLHKPRDASLRLAWLFPSVRGTKPRPSAKCQNRNRHEDMLAMQRRSSVFASKLMASVLIALAFSSVSAQLPFGKTMEGSDQLEAFITVKCNAEHEPCRHTVDSHKIYKHTYNGFPDHRLAIGPHAYFQLAISPGGMQAGLSANYSVLLHQGGPSTAADTAIGKVLNVQGKSSLVTYGCKSNLFSSPKIFVTILCTAQAESQKSGRGQEGGEEAAGGQPSGCPKSYDLSFALKKAIVPAGTSSMHVVPAGLPVVLAVPVQADAADPSSPYDITVRLESTYPESAGVSLAFLHNEQTCSTHLDEALSNQAAAGWPVLDQIFQRVQAAHGDTSFHFIAVRSNSTKRTLIRLATTITGVSGHEELEVLDTADEQMLRRMLIGNRLFARGAFMEALVAIQSAQVLMPTSSAATLKPNP